MDNNPLPKTIEVLREHLHTKVRFINPALAKQLTDILMTRRTNQEIINLLTSDSYLEDELDEALSSLTKSCDDSKEPLGTELFEAVSLLEQEFTAQVTGMLLELPQSTVSSLLNNKQALQVAINKAKTEYLEFIKESVNEENLKKGTDSLIISKEKEELGEIIFEKLALDFPNSASKITGMLLQMEYKDLLRVIADPDMFKIKVKLALNVLENDA